VFPELTCTNQKFFKTYFVTHTISTATNEFCIVYVVSKLFMQVVFKTQHGHKMFLLPRSLLEKETSRLLLFFCSTQRKKFKDIIFFHTFIGCLGYYHKNNRPFGTQKSQSYLHADKQKPTNTDVNIVSFY
jgi:hypothetical protein